MFRQQLWLVCVSEDVYAYNCAKLVAAGRRLAASHSRSSVTCCRESTWRAALLGRQCVDWYRPAKRVGDASRSVGRAAVLPESHVLGSRACPCCLTSLLDSTQLMGLLSPLLWFEALGCLDAGTGVCCGGGCEKSLFIQGGSACRGVGEGWRGSIIGWQGSSAVCTLVL